MASMEERRRLFFIILSSGLFVMSMSAPLGEESRPQTRRKSLVSLGKDSEDGEVGMPGDLAWQAWILVDQGGGDEGGGLDSANLHRRITPKSIFIAPQFQALPACAEGYQADSMNRCVKNVNINPEAHLDFLVQRLNAMYENLGNKNHGDSGSSGSVSTGPLHLDLLNIPVIVDPEDLSEEDEDSDESPSTSLPSLAEEDDKMQVGEVEPVGDDEKNEDGESDKKFFHGPQTTKDGSENDEGHSEKYEGVVPIVDFVDDTNSSYSEVIDYRVESDEKLSNHTTSDQVEESKFEGDDKREHSRGKKPFNESSLAPTVVLLLTPTKLPVSNGALVIAHNSSTGKLTVRRGNKENGTVAEEIITVNLTEHLATASTPIQILFNGSTPDDGLSNTSAPQTTTTEGPEETETDEPDETVTEFPGEDVKDLEDVEEPTESDDEILTHSEAGMMVTIPPRLEQSSTPVDEKDMTASRISSEISINDDFVRETILLGLNVREDSNSTTNSLKPEDTTSTLLDDDKIITVTPEMIPEQETTSFREDVTSYTEAPENEETTVDESDGSKEFTTQTITKQPELPVTARVYEFFSTDQREGNPVIKMEEITNNGNINGEPSTENPLTSSQSPEDLDSFETMTASSSNHAETILHQDPSEKIRLPSPITTNTGKRVGPHAPQSPDGVETKYVTSTLSESPDVYTEIRTIDDHDSHRVSETDNAFSNQRKVPAVPANDFVRFPTWDKAQNRPGFVRFPSEEANSIHTPDFKNSLHHRPYNQQGYRGSVKNRSSPQKVSWPSWWNDRQSIRSRSGVNEKPQDRSPMWFWSRMPLLKDPSLPNQPSNPSDGSTGTTSINYYGEMSSHDVPRAFARSALVGG